MIAHRLSWVVVIAACAAPAARGRSVPAIVLGPDELGRDVRAALAQPVDGVTVAVATLPEPTATTAAADEHAATIARARRAYINADFPGCRAALDPIDALALLDGQRATAAHMLVWRVACRVGEGDKVGARRDAAAIASAGLALPGDISAVTPDVEALIGDVADKIAAAQRSTLHVTARPAGTRVAVDGRDDSCVAPCTITLAPGAHLVVLAADGYTPVARRIQTPDDRELAVELVEAPPPVVASQLQLRVARGVPVDDAATLELAAHAVRARELVVIGVRAAQRIHLVGAVYTDGRVGARAERIVERAAMPGATNELARELLGRAGVIPSTSLARRPWFWVSIAGASVVTAALTALLVFRPDPQTKVTFP